MSDSSRHPNKPEPHSSNKKQVIPFIAKFQSLPQKKLLVASCLLHIVFFSLLFINWQSQEAIKPIYLPENIQARIVSSDELKSMQSKKVAEEKAIQEQKIEKNA